MWIKESILEGKALTEISDVEELKREYDLWCSKLRVHMIKNDFTDQELETVKVKMHYIENEFSKDDTAVSLKKAVKDTVRFLEEKVSILEKESFKRTDLLLIERILNHFYMYYRAMYQSPVHKKCALTQDVLKAIRIGNEYDLQRMLYSILLPIYPTMRQEVYSDNGYGGMRADLYIEDCDLIIETKCTRDSMSEKRLLEELGADGFHYNAGIIYFFICDKYGIIKNSEAFKKAFERERKRDGKTVKVFIMQEIEL